MGGNGHLMDKITSKKVSGTESDLKDQTRDITQSSWTTMPWRRILEPGRHQEISAARESGGPTGMVLSESVNNIQTPTEEATKVGRRLRIHHIFKGFQTHQNDTKYSVRGTAIQGWSGIKE